MTLRRRIILTIAITLGIVEAMLGVAVFVEIERFLLDHTARTLRAQCVPVIEAYLRRAASRDTPLDDFADSLARALTSPDASAIVFDGGGQPVAAGKVLPEDPDPVPPDAATVRALLSDAGDEVRLRGRRGAREMMVFLPLRADDDALRGGVQVVHTLRPVDEFLSRMRWWLAGTAMAVMLAGCGLALLLGSHVAAPLEKLTATCLATARGAWGRRSELPHGGDEVGRLAASFDAMVQRLEMVLAAQHRFAADAAHQLKTPLTILSGHLELLDRRMITGRDAIATSYRSMRMQLQRLGTVVQQLLTLSVLDAGVSPKRSCQDLVGIARAVVEEIRPLAGQRRLDVLQTGESHADVDPDQMREALSNLVDNAVRHTRVDGSVVIEVGDGRVRVQDDGEGIPAHRLARIFDRFYRHPPTGEGSGLGLAIVRGIIEAHAGTVTAESDVGRGTAITVTLPHTVSPEGGAR